MTPNQRTAFDRLLTAWKRHHELRSSGAPLSDLNLSRRALDDARLSAHRSAR